MATEQLEAVLLAEADIENENVRCIGRSDDRPRLLERAADGDDFDPCLTAEYGSRAVPETGWSFPAAGGTAAFIGDFVFKLASGSPQRIPTRIEFGANYPDDEPRAFHLGTRFPHDGDHHFYPSGRCCLWLDVETRWKPSDPGSLRRFLDELTAYYLRQLMMEANPKLTWPGRARGHGHEGHLEHLQERFQMTLEQMPIMLRALEGAVNRNAPCPCGRRVRYRKCHRNRIVRFRKLADPGSQQQVVQLLRKIKAAEPSRRRARRDQAVAQPRNVPPLEPAEAKTESKPTRVTLDAILAKVSARTTSRASA